MSEGSKDDKIDHALRSEQRKYRMNVWKFMNGSWQWIPIEVWKEALLQRTTIEMLHFQSSVSGYSYVLQQGTHVPPFTDNHD